MNGKARAREKGNTEWVECLDKYIKSSWVSFKKYWWKSVLGVWKVSLEWKLLRLVLQSPSSATTNKMIIYFIKK